MAGHSADNQKSSDSNPSKQAVSIIWFKRDLRVTDHLPLTLAAAQGNCLPLFIIEPNFWSQPDADRCHYDFMAESLRELDDSLKQLGGRLIIRIGEAVDVFRQLAQQFRINQVYSHEETGNGWTFTRDKAVAKFLRSSNIPWQEERQCGVIRRLQTRNGWAARWTNFMRRPIALTPGRIQVPQGIESQPIPKPESLGLGATPIGPLQIGGESTGLATLESFLEIRGADYRRAMSSPLSAEDACSRMSPYFAWGCVSLRTTWQRLQQRRDEVRSLREAKADIDPRWLGSLASYQSRLSWHCHFMQKLEDEPSLEFRNLNRAYDGLREDAFNEEFFAAWCDGRTGFPLVDACMRALQQTRWINFRMRAMLMSFSSYDLWLHWRQPALHLARMFLDYEPGIHYPQSQMQSGVTGINTIRIYSPTKQAQDQDPQGEFIRRFIPELAGCPTAFVHEPWLMSRDDQKRFGCWLGKDYPKPLVDHQAAAKSAQQRIYAIRRSTAAVTEAATVLKKHGSRKRRDPSPKPRHQEQNLLPGFDEE